jgi:uncharacterized UBP type Zn finger protein
VADDCAHIDASPLVVEPNTPDACEECLAMGALWVHLRVCLGCGHVGCCDESPNHHATLHFEADGHPLVRSYEPGEDWFYCYVDDVAFLVAGAPPAPSHA